jgi:hypothetical protein
MPASVADPLRVNLYTGVTANNVIAGIIAMKTGAMSVHQGVMNVIDS